MRCSDHTYLAEGDKISVERISTGTIEVYFAGPDTIKTGFRPNIAQHWSMDADQARDLRDQLERALAAKLPLKSAVALAAVASEAKGRIS